MHEYEFRLVVRSSEPFPDDWLLSLSSSSASRTLRRERVLYAKPHFRFRAGRWETKRKVSSRAVYHDGVWLNWVHSVEKPFERWSRTLRCRFLHETGNFQDPFRVEWRRVVDLDPRAKLYTFRGDAGEYRCVFEWEYGSFPSPMSEDSLDGPRLLGSSLALYTGVLDAMRRFDAPARDGMTVRQRRENVTRKPVTNIPRPLGNEPGFVFAHKADGIFGIVYCYRDRIKEMWEDYEVRVRKKATLLGDGLVFAAERLDDDGTVLLLDVYQVRGSDTIPWCRRAVLTEFLPRLETEHVLPEGYRVQRYYEDLEQLPATAPFRTDGWIAHDVVKDKAYKWKEFHSIDLMYSQGYFWASYFKLAAKEEDVAGGLLEDGCVYEIATADGRVVRKREDRFQSNTKKQILHELSYGWGGSYRIPIREEIVQKKVPERAKKMY